MRTVTSRRALHEGSDASSRDLGKAAPRPKSQGSITNQTATAGPDPALRCACGVVESKQTVMVAGVVKKRHRRLLADLDKARADVEASRDDLLRATAVPQPA